MTVHQLFENPAAASDAFEAIWKIWPNKAKKLVAKAKYQAILRGRYHTRTIDRDSGQYIDIELEATADQILAGVRAYVSAQIDTRTYRLKDDGKYIPHLSTWLNQGRFEDWL